MRREPHMSLLPRRREKPAARAGNPLTEDVDKEAGQRMRIRRDLTLAILTAAILRLQAGTGRPSNMSKPAGKAIKISSEQIVLGVLGGAGR
jgi:hypothetical protein